MDFQERASQAIRDSGGRMTAQRQIIVELLADAHEDLDADGLFQQAHACDTSISLATVYRTLNTLEAAGLVRQHYNSRDHDRKVYQLIEADAGYHFTCRNCRRVIHFESALVQQIKQMLEMEFGVQVMNACVCMDGLCPDCQTAQLIKGA
ncbi:MAG: transcriptional repressor [Chloroflexi bacterium]|nr:transcriptional repressor [Chloroflexota bacterium]